MCAQASPGGERAHDRCNNLSWVRGLETPHPTQFVECVGCPLPQGARKGRGGEEGGGAEEAGILSMAGGAICATRSDWSEGSVTKSRAASLSSFIWRSMPSARSLTSCSRRKSLKVVSMWRIAITLAIEVAAMMTSSSRKLPNVNCPIESENDRIRFKSTAKAGGMTIRA